MPENSVQFISMSSELVPYVQGHANIATAKLLDPPREDPFPTKQKLGRLVALGGCVEREQAMVARGAAGADEWWQEFGGLIAERGYIRYWHSPNEPHTKGRAACDTLAAFLWRWLDHAEARGLFGVMANFSQGTPEPEDAVAFAALAKRCAERGHAFCFHEYWADRYGRAEQRTWNYLRFPRFFAALRAAGHHEQPQVVIGENGCDRIVTGSFGGWREAGLSERDYGEDLRAYREAVAQYSYVKAIYHYAAGERAGGRWVTYEVNRGVMETSTAANPAGGCRLEASQATAPPATPPTAPATEEGFWYTVQAGDTLGHIAYRYNTTTARIVAANNLTNPNLIRVGQRLWIPGTVVEQPTGIQPYDGRCLSPAAYREYVQHAGQAIVRVIAHHTYIPTLADWRGESTMRAMRAYYEGLGWTSGPHAFVGPDGIWIMSPLGALNRGHGKETRDEINVEIVGDYTKVRPSGEVLSYAVECLATLVDASGGEVIHVLRKHNDYANTACPGARLTADWAWFRGLVAERVAALRQPDPGAVAALWQEAEARILPQMPSNLLWQEGRRRKLEQVSDEWIAATAVGSAFHASGTRYMCQVWTDPARQVYVLMRHPLDGGSVEGTRWSADRILYDERGY